MFFEKKGQKGRRFTLVFPRIIKFHTFVHIDEKGNKKEFLARRPIRRTRTRGVTSRTRKEVRETPWDHKDHGVRSKEAD